MSSRIFFDKQDYDLLHMVNQVLDGSKLSAAQEYLFNPALHPHGIKELVATREMRIAFSVMNLLSSLETGGAPDRLQALAQLYDEVVFVADSTFRFNTGRVLLQIMKELVRSYGNPENQLVLAHYFRKAATGNRRFVRKMLQNYHLLEMPEEWNQITFDHRVHDAHTKGRKTPTHLIMDAWIKGIKSLTVVYYNFIDYRAVQELLQASAIMGIKTKIGIEYRAVFRNRYVPFIWVPFEQITDTVLSDLSDFLQKEPVQYLMQEGREASAYYTKNVLVTLDKYNAEYRHEIGRYFDVALPEISHTVFAQFVSSGQASLTHLAELVHRYLRQAHVANCKDLRALYSTTIDVKEKERIKEHIEKMRNVYPETLLERFIIPVQVAGIFDPSLPTSGQGVPSLLHMEVKELLKRLHKLRRNGNIVLEISMLTCEDVLELLYENEGRITHLELFNLKSDAAGKNTHIKEISDLQYAINQNNAIPLKRIVADIVSAYQEKTDATSKERTSSLLAILYDIQKLQLFYAQSPLKARIGSDSTSRLDRTHGMGFVWIDSLPARIQKKVIKTTSTARKFLPLHVDLQMVDTWSLGREAPKPGIIRRLAQQVFGYRLRGYTRNRTWQLQESSLHYMKEGGGISTLGGVRHESASEFTVEKIDEKDLAGYWGRLNTTFANWVKVLFGFVLACATFAYTQEWWVLVWLSGPIWFGITGLRNIIQAVLAGRGLTRTSFLHWKAYVNWSRLSDSLMYTGISVPLLELFLRWWLLKDILNITAASDPLLFYTIVSVANGFYIASHNYVRGLQKEAIIGNLFRSVLAIPVAMLYSFLLGQLVVGLSLTFLTPLLIDGAAIISKLASDTVAGIIEGFADRTSNLQMRYWDYTHKVRQFFNCYAKLELQLPEENMLYLVQDPSRTFSGNEKVLESEKILLIHALDLMYFLRYQPQSATALKSLLTVLTSDERKIFVEGQFVLKRKKAVSQLFVDGVMGVQFSKALSFYLNAHQAYLATLTHMLKKIEAQKTV